MDKNIRQSAVEKEGEAIILKELLGGGVFLKLNNVDFYFPAGLELFGGCLQ